MFGVASAILPNSIEDTLKYVEEPKYYEGTIKEIFEFENEKGSYNIALKEKNAELMILSKTVKDLDAISNLKTGDEIVFALDIDVQKQFEDSEDALVIPIYLSSNGEEIVTIESYQAYQLQNMKTSVRIALIVSIICGIVSIIFYIIYFKVYKRKNNDIKIKNM